MLTITAFTCENLKQGCVTDELHPRFSFTLDSDREGDALACAVLCVNGWTTETTEQIAIPYEGPVLKSFTEYTATVTVTDTAGQTAEMSLRFETGRQNVPWEAEWISDATYEFVEKKVSPKPMTFRRTFSTEKKIKSAKIYATAMGIYELSLNGKKVGDEYFAPGFTAYRDYLQYQTYDVTDMMSGENTLMAVVSGGWAAGVFGFTRKNRISAKRQALLLELRITYEDGTKELVVTDENWEVTEEGNYRMADLYDGETYDATVDLTRLAWRHAARETLDINPKILAAYGSPVRAHERLVPTFAGRVGDESIYDFGQNFAGVVCLKINGKRGQTVSVRHAEILNPDGTLNTVFLRTAKACTTYTCTEGEQTYSPRLTYMGFRYIGIAGIGSEDVEVSALALYSDLARTGEFTCSNEKLNRLQENIIWSSKSNFVDIPTDCPQRDERMGWTGDIAVFSPTACYNYDMSRFLGKWLRDLRAEQLSTGGIPNTIPVQGYGFPETMPAMAIDFWGDACVLVPWAEYRARGDIGMLKNAYPAMKKYVNACKFWAGFGLGCHRYIWHTPSVLHFGDWVAPDVKKMSQWQKRSKWTATASLKNTSSLIAKIAEILGETEDAAHYAALGNKVADAYRTVFTDGNGKLKEEFQTAYVLPLYFEIFQGEEKRRAAENLARLVEENGYCIGTGFPGTPYILFALADNGRADTAYRMLLNEKCPSWLYEIKAGATTIWERWDGLDENGVCPIGDDGTDLMISYNHYASGAVGDFFYRRIAGIEPVEAGYRKFRIAPVLGGGITYARGSVLTPYGRVTSDWKIESDQFYISVEVPMGTVCELKLPDDTTHQLVSGHYSFAAEL